MCNAIAIAMAVQGVGNVVQGVAAKQHGDAAKAAHQQSADLAERAAADAIERGKIKDMQTAMHGSATVAAQRVIQSGTGADVNVGGTLATQEATAAVSSLDQAVVRRNAALEAYGLSSRAQVHRQQGEYAQAEGNAAMLGTFLGGVGKLIGQGGKMWADQAPGSEGGGNWGSGEWGDDYGATAGGF